MTLYLTPRDHAFASGPVFFRPGTPEEALAKFRRAEDAELLSEIFDRFESVAYIDPSLRLSLNARVVSKNREKVVRIGPDCAIRGVLRANPGGSIIIGDTVYIGDGVILDSMSSIEIGRGTLIAHGVQILDNDSHPIDADDREAHFRAILGLPTDRPYQIATKPVKVGQRCWIGFNSAIMKGVTIGDESIVASGSVVVKDVPPRTVVAGNPARVVKVLDPEAPVPEVAPRGLRQRLMGRLRGARSLLKRVSSI